MRTLIDLQPILAGEIINYQFDFRDDLNLVAGESIVGQTIAISVYSGVADPGAATMLRASLTITSGTIVNARLGFPAFVGNIYWIMVTITTSLGNIHTQSGYLAALADAL